MLRDWMHKIYPAKSKNDEGPKYRLALDIGTEYVKAVYLKTEANNAEVIGVGRARQDYTNMESGAVASISGVVGTCRQAMTQGSIIAGVKPKEVVIGLASQFVTGMARAIKCQRPKPERPISQKELKALVADLEKQALASVTEEMAAKLGYKKLDLELVNSSLVSITIDGYPVTNPLDFRGRNLEMTVFMTFAPYVHASTMRTIASRLGLDLVGLVAEPYAVAASTFSDEAYEFGALVIDIGGGSTDIALMQKRGITATKMMAMGGRAFTKGIAAYFRKTLKEAEQMKLDYAEKVGAREVKPIIDADLEIWQDALLITLNELYTGTPLPHRIWLCGGGSGLPGVAEVLQGERITESGLFEQTPSVTLLRPEDISGIEDPKLFFTGPPDVTPKGLACQGVILQPGKKGILGGATG